MVLVEAEASLCNSGQVGKAGCCCDCVNTEQVAGYLVVVMSFRSLAMCWHYQVIAICFRVAPRSPQGGRGFDGAAHIRVITHTTIYSD